MSRYSCESYIESLYQSKTMKVGDKVVDVNEYKKQQRAAMKKKRKNKNNRNKGNRNNKGGNNQKPKKGDA